jgi:putative flippase GtrA
MRSSRPLVDRPMFTRLLRYSAVSGVSTITSLSILGMMVGGFAINAGLANVVATTVGTVPSFELNRRWVWVQRGPRSLFSQVVPFCSLSFAGLVLSTLCVRLVSAWSSGWSRGHHTMAVEFANLGAYGSLWVVQYVVLDRVLFRVTAPQLAGPGDAAGADADDPTSSERQPAPGAAVVRP